MQIVPLISCILATLTPVVTFQRQTEPSLQPSMPRVPTPHADVALGGQVTTGGRQGFVSTDRGDGEG